MPLSVSGCLNSCLITAAGAVITSAPSLADVEDMDRIAYARDQDLRREIIIVVDHADIGDQLDARLADIVKSPNERRDEGRACLGRQQRLVG